MLKHYLSKFTLVIPPMLKLTIKQTIIFKTKHMLTTKQTTKQIKTPLKMRRHEKKAEKRHVCCLSLETYEITYSYT